MRSAPAERTPGGPRGVRPMATRSESSLSRGVILDGRYELRELLGTGAHAHVWRAYHMKLDRDVAIKVLRTDAFRDDPARLENLTRRFEREARLIAQLRDPHTITMYDYGIVDGALPYMVVEYIRGVSLKEVIREGEPLAPERVAKILYQILRSLQEAHALGMLHRDIKPDNVMLASHLGGGDQVKLLDFGIAKLTDTEQADLTAEGSIVGTPRYIAPERIRGEVLSPASDLYAVGLLAWEMLTGSRVLEGIRGVRVLQEHLVGPSIRLPADAPIPASLRQLVDKMTEKSIDARYALAREVIEDIEAHYSTEFEARSDAPPIVDLSVSIEDQLDTTEEVFGAVVRPSPRSMRAVIVLALALFILLLLVSAAFAGFAAWSIWIAAP